MSGLRIIGWPGKKRKVNSAVQQEDKDPFRPMDGQGGNYVVFDLCVCSVRCQICMMRGKLVVVCDTRVVFINIV